MYSEIIVARLFPPKVPQFLPKTTINQNQLTEKITTLE